MTATVYLIANVLGNPGDRSDGGEFKDSKNRLISQGDLAEVAKWDPWFRRRWLDYFDLYELLDGQNAYVDSAGTSVDRDINGVQGAGVWWTEPQPVACGGAGAAS